MPFGVIFFSDYLLFIDNYSTINKDKIVIKKENFMLKVSNVSLLFSDRKLFDEVNITFTPGNCYGVIGANGAGKSTFLKILSGELQPTTGEVILDPHERLTVLKQDHFAFEDERVIDTVIMGHKQLLSLIHI